MLHSACEVTWLSRSRGPQTTLHGGVDQRCTYQMERWQTNAYCGPLSLHQRSLAELLGDELPL